MSKKSILIVDDELEVVAVLTELFESEGWEIYSASNGKEALQKIQSQSPNVVLSDIQMPDMDGLQLLEEIYKSGVDTPVILLTGFRDAKKMQRAWESCVFDFTDKPFNTKHLLTLVESAREFGADYVRSARSRFSRIRNSNAA
jgi:two-component system nitrogen regulation response regulator NtrX